MEGCKAFGTALVAGVLIAGVAAPSPILAADAALIAAAKQEGQGL